MRTFFKRLEKFCKLKENKLRKEYTQLRLDAIEAQRSGDVIRYLALNARADRMLDQVIYS